MSDNYVEVRFHNASNEIVGTTHVICPPGSEDCPLPGGAVTFSTVDHCATNEDIEIETRGQNTGIISGVVQDHTGNAVNGAVVYWGLGGMATTNAQGYFNMVAVAGKGVCLTIGENSRANLRYLSLKSGDTHRIAVTVLPN